MADDEVQAVSQEGEQPTADEGHSEETTSDDQSTEDSSESTEEQSKKGGYDDLPDYAKDIIKRQAQKAKDAERRAIEAEAKAQTLSELKSQSQPTESIDEDTKARIDEFKNLAKHAGYYSKDEVDQYVASKFSEIEKQQEAERDRQDLQQTLEQFDGKALPKITVDEIQDFLEDAARDPALQHWTQPSVPFAAIARQIKQKEIQQMEVDRLLKSQGDAPPAVEKGADSTKKSPSTSTPRFDNMAQLTAHLKKL